MLRYRAIRNRVHLTQLIVGAKLLSRSLHLLLSDNRHHVIKSRRAFLCLLYWSIIFEHHRGILHLLQRRSYHPAFALLRPFEEAFFRSFVVMYGTAKQVAAIEKGTYKVEFETMGNQIKEKLRLEPHSGRWLKDEIKMMHELIHGGPDMFMREFMSGLTRSEGFDSESGEPFRLSVNKTSDYPDMYVRILVHQTSVRYVQRIF